MNNIFKQKINWKVALTALIGVFLVAVLTIWLSYKNFDSEIYFPSTPSPSLPGTSPISSPKVEGIKTFASEEDFKNYLAKAETLTAYSYFGMGRGLALEKAQTTFPSPSIESPLPERVSETTVQVPGIDEPDIVKTDGKEIYFSPGRVWPIWREPIVMGEKMPSPYSSQEPETTIIKAFPPSDLAQDSKIEKSGDLLLSKNILVIFSGQEIIGYDVSNPKKPEKKWELKLDEKNSILTSRLYKDKIYLVTKNLINEVHPCPIKPLIADGKILEISCQEIYHPELPASVDVAFLAMVLDPVSGKIENKISFVGSSGQSVVYMSPGAIYVTYSYYESPVKFFSQFLKEKCQDLTPSWVLEKLEKLEGYDISQPTKVLELQTILEKYLNSLDNDERLKVENELTNRMTDYYKERKRELEKSGILKIDLEKLEITAAGNVPGHPLNQFALDEYQENLRIATTVGERFGWFGFGMSGGESANDVYILDKNLQLLGKILDLGLTEKIYAARFIEDKGFLVTFRQTDPFYVLDLSNPQKPELKGELKIPGYSSYLHPITKDKILGIGKEEWQVKISFFDSAQKENPKELDKYILNESWSEILNTHHAFLLDKEHEIFFLPGSQGGYIFSYKNNKLELIKAVSGISAKRALYINDYLYIIGDNKIIVLDENIWQKANELELK